MRISDWSSDVCSSHLAIANAVGAAIAQVGGQIEQIVDYDVIPRAVALDRMREDVRARVAAAGGDPGSIQLVDAEEDFLSRSEERRVGKEGVCKCIHWWSSYY